MKYNLTTDKDATESNLFCNAIKSIVQGRNNILLNVITQEEKNIASIADVDLIPANYPIFGRKGGVINTKYGYTNEIGLRETSDGKWCFIIDPPHTYKKYIEDDIDGEPVYEDIVTDYNDYLVGITFDSSTDIEPEWKIEEE